ncbi:AbrB family transcriptional regulator [Rouxiella sp. Mn2063]|uniref:AbrB family transcriptional regulator n=1 Tax=Rouxiella sp. Mn2063 TaxID=3395262 RepID=UPI003BE657BF
MSLLKTAPSPMRVSLYWLLLIVLSVVMFLLLEKANIPAAPLLGTMIVAIILATCGGKITIPKPPFYLAQAAVGCLIAGSITTSIYSQIARDWPIFIGGVFSVIFASTFLGWLLTRLQVMPGSTAIWGTSPGAATAMSLMAESYGADIRLVAFMQYLRVGIVAVVATLVAKIWTPAGAPTAALHIEWFPPFELVPFLSTIGVVIAGATLGKVLRIPAGPLLFTIVLAAVLQDTHLVTLFLPPYLLIPAYALVGWSIGLRFTREILKHVAHALPRILLSTFCLIAICGGFAVILVHVADVDPLTAYLAMSPGGADSVAIIASSSHVDMPFVMALQTMRLILVILISPTLARLIAKLTLPKNEKSMTR